MWGKIIIPMYRLWLNGLYGLYGPRCPLFLKRPINLISLSLNMFKTNITRWCNSKQCASLDVFWKSRFAASCLSFISNWCAWCGNDDLFHQITANSYIYSFFLDLIYEFIRLFFLSPCILYWTAFYVHVYFLFPFRCLDIHLILVPYPCFTQKYMLITFFPSSYMAI